MFGRGSGKNDLNVKRADLTAYIDEGTEIEGRYNFSGTVMLNGKLSGEIASGQTVIVGDKGVIHASIRAGWVTVSGEVVGNITASERIELRNAARVSGNLEAPVIVLDEGAVFEGQCRMTASPSAAASVVALKRP
ncbi:MAG: bactofilin family protein [Candidatus Rokuibacteriota bacterium]